MGGVHRRKFEATTPPMSEQGQPYRPDGLYRRDASVEFRLQDGQRLRVPLTVTAKVQDPSPPKWDPPPAGQGKSVTRAAGEPLEWVRVEWGEIEELPAADEPAD